MKKIKFLITSCCCPIANIDTSYIQVLKALGFKDKIIKKCWKIFNEINNNNNDESNNKYTEEEDDEEAEENKISFMQFTEYFNLDYSHPFVIKCFSCFDITDGGDVDFLEFMLSVWNTCSMRNDTLLKFTFDIYDTNSDGKLSNSEMKDMIKEFYGTNNNTLALSCLKALMETSEYQGGVIDVNDFKEYAINHSMLLFPIFQLQYKIQSKVMGIKYWENDLKNNNISYNRMKKNKPKLIYDSSRLPALLQAYKIGGCSALLSLANDLANSDTKYK